MHVALGPMSGWMRKTQLLWTAYKGLMLALRLNTGLLVGQKKILRKAKQNRVYRWKEQKARNMTKEKKQTQQKSPPTTSHGGRGLFFQHPRRPTGPRLSSSHKKTENGHKSTDICPCRQRYAHSNDLTLQSVCRHGKKISIELSR